jgi:hypothetical protein
MLELTRGDDAQLLISDLAFNGSLTNFVSGDIVTWTLTREWDDTPVIQKASNISSGVTYNIGNTTGSVNILTADWSGVAPLPEPEMWVYDLQLVRSGTTSTLVSGRIKVLPDATH